MNAVQAGSQSLTSPGLPRGRRAPTPHETPARIGPYLVTRAIGEGGFGEIFAAVAPDGREVAVKRLRRELALRAEAILRFEREIDVVRRIRHPNLISVLDVGDDAAPWFAMELLHGVDLGQRLAEVGRMSPGEALEVLAPVAEALAAAHAAGVVHRDLKPSNVFLDRSRVVLLDFGVAKLLDDGGPQLTRSRIQIGSPSCMAPEQILGRSIDPRTDVYGLGVLAHHLMAGRPPFAHTQSTAVRQMHLTEPPPPVSRRAPVGLEIDRAVARAMSKEPGDRQAGVLDLIRELEAAVCPASRRASAAPGRAEVGEDESEGEAARPSPAASVAVHVDTLDGEALPAIVACLGAIGLEVAFEADNAATMLLALSPDPVAAREQRRAVVACAVRAVRGGGAACFVGVGAAAALLRLGAWIPARPMVGVLAMPEALEGIAAEGRAIPGYPLVELSGTVGIADRSNDQGA